jgi:hypothetical protein
MGPRDDDDDKYEDAQEKLWDDGINATDDMIREQMEDDRRNEY